MKKIVWLIIFDLDGTLWQGSISSMSEREARDAGPDILNAHLCVFPGARETLELLANRPDVILGISSFNIESIGIHILGELGLLKFFERGNVVIEGPDKGNHVKKIIENTLRSRPELSRKDIRVIFVDDRFYYSNDVLNTNPDIEITCITSPGHHEFTNAHFRRVMELTTLR